MILALVSGFIFGIFLGSFIPITFGFFLVGLFVTGTFFIYRYFLEGNNRLVLTLVTLTMLGLLCGVGRIFVSDLYTHSHLEKFVGQKISAEGIIVSEPDIREKNTKLTVRLDSIFPARNATHSVAGEVGTTTVAVRENILATVSLYPEFRYGDKVKMDLKLEEPKAIDSGGGRIFDYKGYLRVRGIWYTSQFTQIKLISKGHGAFVKDILFKIKHKFTDSLDNALPQPESSLMAGLLLGAKQSLGKDLLSEFQRTGTSHIVVLSGYNIAVVASSIMALFKFLPKNLSFGF